MLLPAALSKLAAQITWGTLFTKLSPPQKSTETHMPKASIYIDPTIILLGLWRPRHHPYGRDDNTSCETLWKSWRKKLHVQFSARLVRAGIVEKSSARLPPTLSNQQCNVTRQPLGEARRTHARQWDHLAIPVPKPYPFRRYPHFYPQAQPTYSDTSRRNSVHNRDGDIFVNNRQDSGPDAPTPTRKAHLEAPEKASRRAVNNA